MMYKYELDFFYLFTFQFFFIEISFGLTIETMKILFSYSPIFLTLGTLKAIVQSI